MFIKTREYQELFLEALRAGIRGQRVAWKERSMQEWSGVFALADMHHVLPLVYEAVAECRAAALADRVMFAKVREKSLRLMALQRTITEEFLELYAHLQQMGVKPLAVKGIVCRSLYPNPDVRLSADEDLLIPKEQFEACQEAMLLYGMQQLNPETGTENYETAYKKTGGFLVIELHRMLFPENEKWCIGWNGFFDEIHKQAIDRKSVV